MKKDQLKVFIVACLIVTVCAFGYATYAFYQSTFTGTASGTLAAKWDFDFLGKDTGEFNSLKGTTYKLDLGKSCKNCVTVGKDVKLQPGSTGTFSIKVDASTSKVKTTAKVSMYGLTMGGGTSFPSGLKFYLVEDGGTETILAVDRLATTDGVALFDNTKNAWAAETASKTAEKSVRWAWEYDTGNDNEFSGKNISFNLKAVAEQVAE